jgi:hypothetical protein
MKKKSAAQSERAEFPTDAIGQDLLQNRADGLEREYIEQILKGDSNTEGLKSKKESCQKKLDELKSPVTTPEGFRSALNDIDSYEKMLKKLRTPAFDNVDIENLVGLGSDFGPFFSKRLSKKFEEARVMMIKRQRTSNALLPQKSDPELVRQAEAEWEAAKITELRKNYKIDWINRRIAELQAEREIDAESRDDLTLVSEARIHKRTLEIEERNAILVGKILPHEDKLEIANILLEAKAIREERVKDYLLKRFETVADKFKILRDKKPPRISDIQIKDTDRFLTGFKKKALENPELYKLGSNAVIQALENLDHVEETLEVMTKELEFIDDFNKDPERVKTEMMSRVANVKTAIQSFTPERIDQLLAKIEADERARIDSIEPGERTKHDEFGKSEIYKNRRDAILGLREGNKQIAEIENQIQRMESMDPEEVLDIRNSLDDIQMTVTGLTGEKIDGAMDPKKRSYAEIANRVIKLLNGQTDIVKIKEMLEKNLGEDILGKKHFEFVSNKTFEHYPSADGGKKNLKEFTTKEGNMVFYERGDEWKIIINEENLTDGESLQKQLTHEFRHLEFENNEALKKEWVSLFTANQQKWESIEKAFLAEFPDKKPPTDAGWRPEDILSEIYAMQADSSIKPGRVSKAIMDAGITAKSLGLDPEIIRGFDEEKSQADKAKIAEEEAKGGEGEGSKTEGGGEGDESSFKSNKENIEKNGEEIKRILDSEYVSYVPGGADVLNMMKKFNDETAELNEKYKKTSNSFISGLIKDRVGQVKKDIMEVEKQISMVAGKSPNTSMNPLRDMWNRSRFLALDDILQMTKDLKEWWERRHKRRKEDHAARIGSALFDKIPLPIVGEFGAESGARALKAEHGEVDEWQNRLKHKDAWELEEMIDEMSNEADPNKDMFKAILKILAEKGRINWRNPYLWRLLNKLQNVTKLGEDGGHPPKGDVSLLKNPILLREKLHKSIGAIWDYDEYLKLDRDNGSAYGSGKEKYFKGFDKIQDQITQRLEQLVQEKRNHGHVDPQEFEGLIEYSIKKGKSTTEDCFFHLMIGVAEGILYADRPLALDGEHMNTWPALQWIYNKKPSLIKADYIAYAEKYFGEDLKKGRCGADFKNFYWTQVQNDEMVSQRVRKAASERGWDHDWTRSIAVLGDANTAKQFMRGRSGEQATKITAVENAYAGALQWLEENAKNPHGIDARKSFARQMSWIAMADGIFNRIAYDGGANDTYARGDSSVLSSIPREAGVGNHPNATVGQHRDIMHKFMSKFDAPFFAMARDEAAAKQNKEKLCTDIKKHLSETYGELAGEMEKIKSMDDIYEKMDLIVQTIVSHVPEDEFYTAIASIVPPKKK